VTDDLDGAFADLARAQAVAEALGLLGERARIHFLRGNLFFPRGDIGGCLREHQSSLELARAIGSPELEAQALGGLGDAEYVRGRMLTSYHHLARCVELARAQGLGRVEVANRSQMAQAALYFRPLGEALDLGIAAAHAAAEVGHLRAEINARAATMMALAVMGEPARVKEESARLRDLIDRLGARRFSQTRLLYLGMALLFEGDRAEALRLMREALKISEQTGITFRGPNVLGGLALALTDASERRAALDRGEAIIRQGSVGHNPLRFYPDAIDVALELADWDEAERYALALAEFTAAEPLPWSEFFVARGRALAAFGRDRHDEAALRELRKLRRTARQMDYRLPLPAIERALATGISGFRPDP
jgi:tetratricopeptide (TPR) repeat protein